MSSRIEPDFQNQTDSLYEDEKEARAHRRWVLTRRITAWFLLLSLTAGFLIFGVRDIIFELFR